MPLSEHEQRVLEQMEQALYAEDPRLASTLKTSTSVAGGVDRRRVLLGLLVAVAGLAMVVLGGVMAQNIWVGALGFLAMVLGGAWAATPRRAGHGPLGVVRGDGQVQRPQTQRPAQRQRRRPASGTFMQRMEQQWDRRKEQGPF